MDTYEFEDALTQSKVSCAYPGLETHIVGTTEFETQPTSVFFPGCSFINYALPLVQSVYDLLREAGQVDGISLLCCGKILIYEPDGEAVQATFEEQLRQETVKRGITRYVVACANCHAVMRRVFAEDPATAHVQVVVLPQVLADMGYRVDPATAQQVFAQEWDEGVLGGYAAFAETPEGAPAPQAVFSLKDTCPDKPFGVFAEGLRRLMPEDIVRQPKHHHEKSVCCGSLPRAAGKIEAANKSARLNGEEALEAGANALVTPCVSCCFQLTMAQASAPVYHYLELLYGWRIPWAYCEQYMKLRFLFDENLGVEESARSFMGLAGAEGAE
ncbi:MAG: heterodisulfide reductase-related iron-sulfur binding cluster [Coriobacteriia bacterium]|nr:heterodisulfide reductase-related iron-sulfur binding cluster [Coriobacteriia bacterium]